jgi:ABC-type polysaccharide/polyol phosphate export permease
MKENIQELYRYRELLYTIACRDIRIRYKQSIMGFLWAILMPILIVLSGVVIRYAFAIASGKPLQMADIAGVAVKSLPWAFFVSAIRFGCNSLSNNVNLVTKVYFPKEIFPIAAVLASLFDCFVAAGGLLVVLVAMRIGWSANLLWTPVLILSLVILVTGVDMIVSAASLFFRDVKYIVEVVLTFGVFFTPVFYDIRMLGRNGKWLLLNPIAPIVDGLGSCVAHHQPPQLIWVAYSFAIGVIALLGGYAFFKHLEGAFAESI